MRLIIEIDGEIHQQRQDYDAIRDEYPRMMGNKILRFKNARVLNNLIDVLQEISQFIAEDNIGNDGRT
jgi:5-methyltetrahydrofolate--homocysteine methyltransferase